MEFQTQKSTPGEIKYVSRRKMSSSSVFSMSPIMRLQCLDLDTIQINLGFTLQSNLRTLPCERITKANRTDELDNHGDNFISDRKTLPSVLLISPGEHQSCIRISKNSSEALSQQHHRIQLRTNLTILLDPLYKHFPYLYKELGIELVASFPCYLRRGSTSSAWKRRV